MEIYEEFSYESINDGTINTSFNFGFLGTSSPAFLLGTPQEGILTCSSLSSSEVKLISKCTLNSAIVLDSIFCVIEETSFVLLLVDEKVSTGNTYLYIMDPDTGRTWKTDYQIPEGSVVFQVASAANSNGLCNFVLGSGSYLYFGSIGLSSATLSGLIAFEYSELNFVNLSSLNSKRITALHVFQTPNNEFCYVFAGTDNGIVEVWRYNNGDAKFMCKMSCSGLVSQIEYQTSIPNIRSFGVIFVSFKSSNGNSTPIDGIAVFHIDSKFTMPSKDDRVNWIREGGDQLVSFRSVPEAAGFNVACVYKSLDGSSSFDMYSLATDSNSKVHQVSIADTILDIQPHCGSAGNVTVLTSERLVRFVHSERVPYDSFDEFYSLKPAFDKWFTRDSSSFLYKAQKIATISSMRSKLGSELFFDKLLSLNEIEKARYPPIDPHQFETLFNDILNNPSQGMTLKHCLVYYFLKDDSIVKAEKYAEFFGITRPFILAIDGFWAMDNGHFKEAIQYLADPCVDLDDSAETCLEWPKKILTSLFENGEYGLASTFIKSTTPSLWLKSSISSVLQVLTKVNILECLLFCRLFCKDDLETSLRLIFTEFLSDKRSAALLAAPLSKKEEIVLVKFCKDSVQTSMHDFLLNYLIQRGRYAEALQIYQELFVSKGKENSTRQNLMKNVALLLPRVQLLALGLTVPAYVPPSAGSERIPEMLSQSKAIREGGPTTEQTILQALQQNFLSEPAAATLDQKDIDMYSGFQMHDDSEPIVSTPIKPVKRMEDSPLVSPFIQQPFTMHRKPESSNLPVSGRVSLGRKSISGFSVAGTPVSINGSKKPISENLSPSVTKLPTSRSETPLNNSRVEPTIPISGATSNPTPPGPLKPLKKVSMTPEAEDKNMSASITATSMMNLPPSPLVASAPPLVNRSPFTSKPFTVPTTPKPLLESKFIHHMEPILQFPNTTITIEDYIMDEDLPPPPHDTLSFVHAAGDGELQVDGISVNSSSLSVSSSAKTSPEKAKESSENERKSRRGNLKRTTEKKASHTNRPKRFVSSPGPPSDTTTNYFAPRQLRSTRKNILATDVSSSKELEIPSNSIKRTSRSLRKPVNATTDPILKTPSAPQKNEGPITRGTRSLRPRK